MENQKEEKNPEGRQAGTGKPMCRKKLKLQRDLRELQRISRVDFSIYENRPQQKEIISQIILDLKSMWLYGTSGAGKTYLSALALSSAIKKGMKVEWVEMSSPIPSQESLIQMWYDIYSEKRTSIRNRLDMIYNTEALVINDIDKFNRDRVSSERESYLFDLIDYRLKKITIINSQYSISEFLKSFRSNTEIRDRYGIGQIERRLKENYTEIIV